MGIITARTARGQRSEQEDRLAVLPCADGYMLAVCDGHRGYQTAAKVIVQLAELIATSFSESLHSESDARAFLQKIVERINDVTSAEIPGSTFSLAHISEAGNRVDIAVLGDSPVVVDRPGSAIWVSPEHNVRRNKEDCRFARARGAIIHSGYLYVCEDGNGLQLTRTFGDADFGAVLRRDAEYFSFPLTPFSKVALFSDGVYDAYAVCTKEALASLPLTDAYAIVADALQRGSRDNVSAIVWCGAY